MKILDRETVRELDRRTIEEFGIPGLILMENAGRGAADLAVEMLRDRPGGRIALICGKGNNGGDGFVVARHLHNRGHGPRIVYLGELDGLVADSDAGVNAIACRRMGLDVEEIRDEAHLHRLREVLDAADLVVDGIFGTGLSGAVRGLPRRVIEEVAAAGRPVLALDVPSGIDANTGDVLGVAIRAEATATFAAAKPGLVRGEGAAHAGRVVVVEISIPRELLEGT